jgi:hypothetical protein
MSVEFERRLERLCAYAFFSGQARGILCGVHKNWITAEEALHHLEEALMELETELEKTEGSHVG